MIILENIKPYNNAVQTKQKGAEVEIQTILKNISLMFSGIIEAKKFCGKIVGCFNRNNHCREKF